MADDVADEVGDTGTPLAQSPPFSFVHNITAGDVDCFAITTAGGTIDAWADNGAFECNGDTRMSIFEASDVVNDLFSNDDGNGPGGEDLGFCSGIIGESIVAGDYLVCVSGFSPNSQIATNTTHVNIR